MIKEYIKFYADLNDGTRNKYFCFQINSIMNLNERLNYWSSKMYIRAAWYECKDGIQVLSNEKIDLVHFTDEKNAIFIKK